MSDATYGAGATAWRSGKGHRDENFPVASFLIAPRHRAPVLAFYHFVRTADDIADHATLPPAEKLALLDRLEAGLAGADTEDAVAVRLRNALAERQSVAEARAWICWKLSGCDVTKLRYRDWDDLIDYCRYSAMPVGRFVLRRAWREPRDLAGQRRAVRRAADHQSPAGLPRITAISTGSTSRRMRSPQAARASTSSAPNAPRRPCSLACTSSPARTERLLGESRRLCRGDPRRAACARSRPSSTRWRAG